MVEAGEDRVWVWVWICIIARGHGLRGLKVWMLGCHDICMHDLEKSRKQPGELEVGFTTFFGTFQHSGFSISPQAKKKPKKAFEIWDTKGGDPWFMVLVGG